MTNRRVLFVDDEPNVVDSIKRMIRKSVDVHTSTNPREALLLIKPESEFAVVVSDMRMPQMSGIDFLTAVKRLAPNTVRVMLTGNQDQQTAAGAVNEGEVFKFLNKPCDEASLLRVLEQGVRQYQLVTAERDLLSRTLQGSIKVLVEALSMAKPEIFGSIDRIERACCRLSEGLAGIELWEMQAAARLSRLGCVGISNELLEKAERGAILTERERAEFEGYPQVGANILAEIPRLENVAASILYQLKNFDGTGTPNDARKGVEIPVGARVLRLALAVDRLQMRGVTGPQALDQIRERAAWYDPSLVERLAGLSSTGAPQPIEVHVRKLEDGMTIAEDIQSTKGILIVCRGQAVSSAIRRHLLHFYELGTLADYILVTPAA